MPNTVVISRKWNSPEITATVTLSDINLSMPLAQFMDSLQQELIATAPNTLLSRFTTQKTKTDLFKQQFAIAVEQIVLEMKRASVAVV